MKREQQQRHAIETLLQAQGVQGVHVDIDDTDTAFLDGEVRSEADEIAAVETAIAVGVQSVVDGLHYPGQDATADHFEGRRGRVLQEGHHHAGPATPEEKILRGAHTADRVFDSNLYPPIPTGNPIN